MGTNDLVSGRRTHPPFAPRCIHDRHRLHRFAA